MICICLEECEKGVRKFKCGHEYHETCINKWKGKCPMCRSEKEENKIKYVDLREYKLNEKVKGCQERCHYIIGYHVYEGVMIYCRDCKTKMYAKRA